MEERWGNNVYRVAKEGIAAGYTGELGRIRQDGDRFARKQDLQLKETSNLVNVANMGLYRHRAEGFWRRDSDGAEIGKERTLAAGCDIASCKCNLEDVRSDASATSRWAGERAVWWDCDTRSPGR